MSAPFMDLCRTVKDTVAGQWPDILQALAGLEEQQVDTRLRHKGTPCPVCCAGQNRYSFKDADTGGWACRHCGGGDGWTMLERVNHWSFSESVRAVADYLHIESSEPFSPEKQEARRKKQQLADQRQKQEALKLQAQYLRRANYAAWEWNSSIPADPSHPHLIARGLPPFNLRQRQHKHYGNCLLVPMVNEQWQLMNLERINEHGQKRPIQGATKKGLFYQFGQQTWTLYICESWTTGAAIHIGKPCYPCVLSAFSRVNLDAVAAIALRLYQDSDIVIAADNDPDGIRDAVAVASRYNLKIVIPIGKGQDFCDSLMQERTA